MNVSVTQFGAKGDGKTDDTLAFQNAINAAANSGGGTVLVPIGSYLINPIQSVNLKSNVHMQFSLGASLIAKPVSSGSYNVINIVDVSNVSILGYPTIIGERYEHLGTSGEWGMGINIKGSTNIYIENPNISDCWGDGIYLGSTNSQNYNKGVKIVNPVLNNNRRQGISVISAIGLTIDTPTITNTTGTPPAAGIDFEPNNTTQYLQNITVTNPNIQNNDGHGIQFALGLGPAAANPVSITITNAANVKYNCKHNYYGSATDIWGTYGSAKGKIVVDGTYYLNK